MQFAKLQSNTKRLQQLSIILSLGSNQEWIYIVEERIENFDPVANHTFVRSIEYYTSNRDRMLECKFLYFIFCIF